MPSPKLHLNEHLSPRLAAQLRQYGFDVTSTLEAEMVGATDEEQLAHAAKSQRAILTFNCADFLALHDQYLSEGKDHWGIILSTEETLGVLRRRLLRFLNSVSAEEMMNQIRWLNQFR